MIDRRSLVFVVGAGASHEAGLPLGSELTEQIGNLLDISFVRGERRGGGDRGIESALGLRCRSDRPSPGDINKLFEACSTIRGSMHLALSIDNFIDAHSHSDEVVVCAKLAIAQAILAAERSSRLFPVNHDIGNYSYKQIQFANVKHTWYQRLFHLVADSRRAGDVHEKLRTIGIVCFNYDRCVEHFLHSALTQYFKLGSAESRELMSHLEIIHPYGSLGPLPWSGESKGVEFGAVVSPSTLNVISDRLKTFTESLGEETGEIPRFRSMVHQADTLVFLGLSYNRQNLRLLLGQRPDEEPVTSKLVFGTTRGLSQDTVEHLKADLFNRLRTNRSSPTIYLDRHLTCNELFGEYGRRFFDELNLKPVRS